MEIPSTSLECGSLLPLLHLELARGAALALTPHRGVSTIEEQENADLAGAGSALQSGFHVLPTTSASCCAAYCTCSSVISGKNGMLKTRSQARSA